MELYDENGNLVEGALTPEEVEKRLDEIKEQKEKEIEEETTNLQKTISELEKSIADKNKEIEDSGKKDYNWQELRKQKDTFAKQLEIAKEELKKVVEGVQAEISQKKIDDKATALAGGDKELAEAIKLHYKSFKDSSETDLAKREEEFNQRMEHAALIATGGRVSSLGGSSVRTGSGATSFSVNTEKISSDVKSVGNKLGITDEELKKQGLI